MSLAVAILVTPALIVWGLPFVALTYAYVRDRLAAKKRPAVDGIVPKPPP